ncbi:MULTISPECIES: M23 family metallopeptidase [Roseobacteraceae]|uniref:Murein DD-endopeptidase MepM n=1 Tax=Pseudosulfitobacter pseudonitzschiae TaxID=1402135 RepID=A0A221JXI8_9RHOB|nr:MULTISPECIES: M23 family metallopeptidase [Roseobacteraceae]ASM71317.1 murein DD-endopeptidase MepM [Pseudosulfitobacter pseudonitzschiae]
MRLRYWTALAAVVCVGLTLREVRQAQTPVVSAAPAPVEVQNGGQSVQTDADHSDLAPSSDTALNDEGQKPPPSDDDGTKWSRAVKPGESLDILLAEAGLDAAIRADISRAIGSEFDLKSLKPGHRLALEIASDGLPQNATLEVDDGVNIQAVFGTVPSVRVLPPTLETFRQAGEAEIGNSIYAALDDADIPTRFATDLELVFAGTLDLRRELVGGERLRVAWRENRLDDRVIGEPTIDFAELDLGGVRYEVVWPSDDSRRTSILKDGHQLLAFDQPIKGARLSSAFGKREHPIHGYVRMHNGVDFAAEHGATVHATQSGRVSFIGERSGFGLMIEVEHAQDIQTIYAHLSAVNDALEVGQKIGVGHEIGSVGSTGTSTAPHLHYEVRVGGRPVPPITDARLSGIDGETSDRLDASVSVDEARDALSRLLATDG